MEIFQRSIHSSVKRLEGGYLEVSSSLLDLEHSFHLELRIREGDGAIEAARASMSKTPLSKCREGIAGAAQLVGLRIERGVIREVHRRLGGPRGCAHLVELIDDAVRLVSMILLGERAGYGSDLSEEQVIAEGRKVLRDTCLVFAAEEDAGAAPSPRS